MILYIHVFQDGIQQCLYHNTKMAICSRFHRLSILFIALIYIIKRLEVKRMIQVENLKKRYKDNAPLVLDDISFNIKEGEIVGLIGEKGVGNL